MRTTPTTTIDFDYHTIQMIRNSTTTNRIQNMFVFHVFTTLYSFQLNYSLCPRIHKNYSRELFCCFLIFYYIVYCVRFFHFCCSFALIKAHVRVAYATILPLGVSYILMSSVNTVAAIPCQHYVILIRCFFFVFSFLPYIFILIKMYKLK